MRIPTTSPCPCHSHQVQHGGAAWGCSMGVQHGGAAWAVSICRITTCVPHPSYCDSIPAPGRGQAVDVHPCITPPPPHHATTPTSRHHPCITPPPLHHATPPASRHRPLVYPQQQPLHRPGAGMVVVVQRAGGVGVRGSPTRRPPAYPAKEVSCSSERPSTLFSASTNSCCRRW